VLRLEVLSQCLISERSLRGNGAPESGYAARTLIVRSYFDAVMSVLGARMRNEEGLEDSISLAYDTQPVSWNQFCFDSDEHAEAYDRVVATRGALPIAVRGSIEWVDTRSNDESGTEFAVIGHPQTQRRSGNPPVDGIRFSIWHRRLNAFEGCVAGEEVVSFGLWDQRVRSDLATVISGKRVPFSLGVARLMALSTRQVRIVTFEKGSYRKLEYLPVDRPRPHDDDGREQEHERG
jgi:hypothetical protein